MNYPIFEIEFPTSIIRVSKLDMNYPILEIKLDLLLIFLHTATSYYSINMHIKESMPSKSCMIPSHRETDPYKQPKV